MVKSRYILNHVVEHLDNWVMSPSQKEAGIDGYIKQKWLVAVGPFQQPKSERYIPGWMQKRCIYIQASLVSGIGL